MPGSGGREADGAALRNGAMCQPTATAIPQARNRSGQTRQASVAAAIGRASCRLVPVPLAQCKPRPSAAPLGARAQPSFGPAAVQGTGTSTPACRRDGASSYPATSATGRRARRGTPIRRRRSDRDKSPPSAISTAPNQMKRTRGLKNRRTTQPPASCSSPSTT